MTPKRLYLLHAPVLALFGAAVWLLFGFSAEDAFITYRYAENLVRTGSFVFNQGEPVLALTSPLHGLLSAFLYRATGHTVLANKVLGLLLLLPAAALVLRRYRGRADVQLLVSALVLLPPCVTLWAVGGLETPILLFLVTVTVLLADGAAERPGLGRLCWVFFLAGLAFLTRFDAALFMLPIVLHMMWRSRSVRDIAVATLIGAVLPTTWLAVSLGYYGDLFPTSYYSKRPRLLIPVLIGNGKYVLAYLGFTGVVPALLVILGLTRPRGRTGHVLRWLLARFRERWWLYAAIVAQLLYGLTMAMTHMMFSFRSFVPYLPAFAILIGDLARQMGAARGNGSSERTVARSLAVTAMGLAIFQAYQLYYTHQRSVNGLSPWGEYREGGVAQYVTFIEGLRDQGEDIRRHWATVDADGGRMPRIFTYAGGVVPYTFQESYVYETLVSFRHCRAATERVEGSGLWMRPTIDLRLAADYIHLITPRQGPIAPQLPLPEALYTLISSHEITFDGSRERLLVYFNPAPEPHRWPSRVHDPCP